MDSATKLLNESGYWLVVQLGRMSIELVILAAVVLVAVYVLRVKSPAARHLFWGLLLAKPVVTLLVASPVSLYQLLAPPVPDFFDAPPAVVSANPAEVSFVDFAAVDAPAVPIEITQKETLPFWRELDRYGIVAALWITAVALLGMRLLVGCAYVTLLRSTAKTHRTGPLAELLAEVRRTLRVRRRVRIAATRVAHGPVLTGILRPMILLPEDMAAALTPGQMRHIIAHELAHARRWDNLILLIQRLAEMFFFFHPVVWCCGWMMRREAEAACDDLVVRTWGEGGDSAAAYADSLTRVAEMKCGITRRLLVNTFAAAESDFSRRIRRILGARPTRMTLGLGLATGAVLVLIGVAGLPTAASAPPEGAETPAPATPAPQTSYLEKALDSPVSIEFDNIHLSEIIEFMSDSYDINFVLDNRAIAPPNAAQDTGPDTVTDGMVPVVRLYDVSIRDALTMLLRPLNLAFAIEPSYVWISSPVLIDHHKKEVMLENASDNLKATLAAPVAFEFEDIHISEVCEFISDSWSVNFMMDARVIRPEGATPAEPGSASPGYVTDGMIPYINLKDVSLAEGLEAMLRPLNLTFKAEKDVIWISSPELLEAPPLPSTVHKFPQGNPVTQSSAPEPSAGASQQTVTAGDEGDDKAAQGENRGEVSGTVTNATTGDPVAGAYVGVGDFGDSGGSNHDRHRQEGLYAQGKTDENGNFTLDGLAFADVHLLFVTHPGFVRYDTQFSLSAEKPHAELTPALKPAASINVTLSDGADRSPAGAYFFRLEALDGHKFIPPGRDPHLSAFASPVWIALSPGSTFTFSELETGEYSVDVMIGFPVARMPNGESPVETTDEARTATYYGGASSIVVKDGEAAAVTISRAEHGTRVRVGIPHMPDVPATVPRVFAITRNLAFLGSRPVIAPPVLEDPRLGRIWQGALYSTHLPGSLFVADKRACTIFTLANLPPGKYCVLAGPPSALRGAILNVVQGQEEFIELPGKLGPPEERSAQPTCDKLDPHGGEVVDGLQAVLRADKERWGSGQVPEFSADLLVVGEGALGHDDPPEDVVLEYDNIQYTVRAAGMLSAPGLFGRGIHGFRGSLDRELVDAQNQPLTLTPGKHTVRLAFRIHPPKNTEGLSALVFSNPVAIEIGGEIQSDAAPPETATAVPGPRTLRFPSDRLVGTLINLDACAEDVHLMAHFAESPLSSMFYAPAMGEVLVPGNLHLGLVLDRTAVGDLAFLDALPADALELIRFPSGTSDTLYDEEALEHIAHLTELKVLNLGGCTIGKEHLDALHGLQNLAVLTIWPNPLDSEAATSLSEIVSLKSLHLLSYDNAIPMSVLEPLARLESLELFELCSRSFESEGLKSLAGLPSLKRLVISASEFDPEGLSHLASFPALVRLKFSDLSDAAMRQLPILPALWELEVQGKHAGFSPEAFGRLAQMPRLEVLEVTGRFSDDCVAQLKAARRLGSFSARALMQDTVGITDAALAHLASIPSIEVLDLWSGDFTDAGLAPLAQLPNLRVLTVPNMEITDAGLVHIGKMTHLEKLNLRGTAITDEGLAHLESLTALQRIDFRFGGAFTNEGLDRLRKKVPTLTLVVQESAPLTLSSGGLPVSTTFNNQPDNR